MKTTDHYLYRFEVEGTYDGEVIKRGIFHTPDEWIHPNLSSKEGTDNYFTLFGIFADKLEAPNLSEHVNSISFFTEDGYRKFRKHLRTCKEIFERNGYKWCKHKIPIIPDVTVLYEDRNQVIYDRTEWRIKMTAFLKSKGMDVSILEKEESPPD